jgi:hypothetical protein
VEDDNFSCNETELDSLITRIKLNSASAFSEIFFKRTTSCNKSCFKHHASNQRDWVMEMIPCDTENGRVTRDYLADNHRTFAGHADRIRCPDTTTTAMS